MSTYDIVQRLWGLCHVLRDDGVTYHQYVNELTYLLFLKMAQETGTEDRVPEGKRWTDLLWEQDAQGRKQRRDGIKLLDFYKRLLLDLASASDLRVQMIYAGANSFLSKPKNLRKLIDDIDALDWFDAKKEGLGDLYEGLLEKNATETKSGAGQYFTPRPLIECMVERIQPQPGERVQDPALGTGGFLICADAYVKARTGELYELPTQLQRFQREKAFYGVELVRVAHRLAVMNAIIHGIDGEFLLGDSLGKTGQDLPPADVILTNPPFGTKKGGGGPTRDDFTFPTSNKQLAFLQHIYRGLKPGGRAAVVLPDNVLFEDVVGVKIRQDLLDKCDLHTILRLPTGIFYAPGVKTNVLFFTRGATEKDNTQRVWIYDLRTNMPSFGKRNPLTREHFREFEAAFGDDPRGTSKRVDQGEEGRFRCFERASLDPQTWNLDFTWLRDDSVDHADDLPEPEEIAAEIMEHLRTAMEELEALTAVLEGEASE